MSGLVAVVSLDPGVRARGRDALQRVRHFGHWGEASREVDGAWLGACGADERRAVTEGKGDEAAGDARHVAALAGEIVNAGAVAARLGLSRPASPAEIVVAAWEQWGAGMFERLEGVFALAVWDRRERRLIAGVDARGLGTLHAVPLGGDVIVATAAKAFAVDERFSARLSEQSLAELVTVGWVTRGRGLFDGVESLPLGCHFEIGAGKVAVVRHADDRDLVGGHLRGGDYLDHLEDTMRDLCRDAFASDDVLLPLTGGIDSRLLAVAVPGERRPRCFSFGAPDDNDVRVAALVAARRGYAHTVIPVEPDYVQRHAAQTVWIGEGCTNPVSNVTGSLMDRVGDARAFVSGQGGEVGRRFLKVRLKMVPDWALLSSSPLVFERQLVSRVTGQVFDATTLDDLFGTRAAGLREAGEAGVREGLERTRELDPVDRVDLHTSDAEFWEGRPWLAFADTWVQARAPFHTQRWLRAVLAGHPSERVDDVVRLRLIARMDPAAGRVPSSLTRLPLPVTARVLAGVRRVSRAAASTGGPGATPGAETDAGPGPSAAPRLLGRSLALGGRVVETVSHRLHPAVDRREDWLRTRSWACVEQVLAGDPLAERGLVEPGATGRLLDRCRCGEDLARPVGILLGLELWHRLFVDGDADVIGCGRL